jgi:superfamily I DNA and/or RNA helicase
VPWLVKVPSPEEIRRARKLKPAQMVQLEGLWRTDPEATLEQLQDVPKEQELLKVALRYADAYEYQKVFAPLVQVEADYDKVHFSPYRIPCSCPMRRIHKGHKNFNGESIAPLFFTLVLGCSFFDPV